MGKYIGGCIKCGCQSRSVEQPIVCDACRRDGKEVGMGRRQHKPVSSGFFYDENNLMTGKGVAVTILLAGFVLTFFWFTVNIYMESVSINNFREKRESFKADCDAAGGIMIPTNEGYECQLTSGPKTSD